MSGIYIPGMEMPTSCSQCPLHDEDYRGKEHCDIGWKKLPKAGEKPGWCPLVPVPPHGDLIDRDALCDGLVSNHPVVIHAKSAPTIIPASGKDGAE